MGLDAAPADNLRQGWHLRRISVAFINIANFIEKSWLEVRPDR